MKKQSTSILQDSTTSVVAFRLDQRTFALPLNVITQILPSMTITPIPHLNPIVKGTINIRGESVLVISLRKHFNLEEKTPELYTPLLLLTIHNRQLALIVDEVLDVMNLPLEKLDTLDSMLPEGIENTPLLLGLAYFNEETVLILNPDKLFYNQSLESKDGIGNQHEQPVPSLSSLSQQTQ